ncbi:ribosomal protein S6 kinase alpha-3-like [Lithobates pipiens]
METDQLLQGFTGDHLKKRQEIPLEKRFKFRKHLGKGSFGRVDLVKDRTMKQKVALKSIRISKHLRRQIYMERKALDAVVGCPFLIQRHLTWESKDYFWIAMEHASGGDLHLLGEQGDFDIDTIRFYAAECIIGLQQFHEKGFIHRDIKPKNVFIGRDGHIRIGDFGLATEQGEDEVGTPGYIAPEIYTGEPYSSAVDWFSLGVMLFVLSTGVPAKRCKASIVPAYGLDCHLEDLIIKLMHENPTERLGQNGDIRSHPFFSTINWDDLQQLKITPPFIPVDLVKDRTTKQKVALKSIRISKHLRRQIYMERKALDAVVGCPFLIQRHLTWESKDYFWIAMEHASGGDLHLLGEQGDFDIDTIRFYAAECIIGLQQFHEKGFIHRDIKPKNVFIGRDGHIRIGDFGLATEQGEDEVGTPGYIAPEIYTGEPYSSAVDWFSLGVMLFVLSTGVPAKRCKASIVPAYGLDCHLEDLIIKLMHENPTERLGQNGDIRSHPFFSTINWDDLQQLKITPPFIPCGK